MNTCLRAGEFDGPLQRRVPAVPTVSLLNDGGGEHVLPQELPTRVGVFDGQSSGQEDVTRSQSEVALVHNQTPLEMSLQWLPQAVGQDREPILAAFALADDDPPVGEVQVLHPQCQAFMQAQTRTVDQLGHEFVEALHLREQPLDLLHGKDDRKPPWTWSADKLAEVTQGQAQHLVVHEEQRIERLVLRTGRELPDGQVGQEALDVLGAEFPWGAATVETVVLPGPVAVSRRRTGAVVTQLTFFFDSSDEGWGGCHDKRTHAVYHAFTHHGLVSRKPRIAVRLNHLGVSLLERHLTPAENRGSCDKRLEPLNKLLLSSMGLPYSV